MLSKLGQNYFFSCFEGKMKQDHRVMREKNIYPTGFLWMVLPPPPLQSLSLLPNITGSNLKLEFLAHPAAANGENLWIQRVNFIQTL